jgi:hypothetical protein
VKLIHQSAKDYLQQNVPDGNRPDHYHIKSAEAHRTLATACFSLAANAELLSPIYGKDDGCINNAKDFPLLEYAVTHWLHHAKVASQSSFYSLARVIFSLLRPLPAAALKANWKLKKQLFREIRQSPRLHLAMRYGPTALVRHLLRHKGWSDSSNMEMHGLRPLCWAAIWGDTDMVELLRNSGASINANDSTGFGLTPLHWASRLGHPKVVELLLDRGADADAVAMGDRTPLAWATENGHTAVLELLLRNGPEVNYSFRFPPVIIQLALLKGLAPLLEILLLLTLWLMWESLAGLASLLPPPQSLEKDPMAGQLLVLLQVLSLGLRATQILILFEALLPSADLTLVDRLASGKSPASEEVRFNEADSSIPSYTIVDIFSGKFPWNAATSSRGITRQRRCIIAAQARS